MSYKFELALRQYIAGFDCTNNLSPAESKSLFDMSTTRISYHNPRMERFLGGDDMMHLNGT